MRPPLCHLSERTLTVQNPPGNLKPVVGAVDSDVAVADGDCCCLIPNTGARVDCSVEDRFNEAGSADDHLTSSAGEPQER